MSHGNDIAVSTPGSRTCGYPWCAGLFCGASDNGERFHRGILSVEGHPAESIGVDIVCNDYADGTSTGPLIDITFTGASEMGVAQHSVGLAPESAMRHAAAIAQAVSLALMNR